MLIRQRLCYDGSCTILRVSLLHYTGRMDMP